MIRVLEPSGVYQPRTHTRTRERSRKSLPCNDLGLWTRTVRPNQFRQTGTVWLVPVESEAMHHYA